MPMPQPIEYVSVFMESLRASPIGTRVDTNEGSRWDALGGALAQMFARANRAQVEAFDAHTRERSKGADLDDYCRNNGPIRRMPASKPKGYGSWERASTAFGATEIPLDHEVRAAFDGKTYVFRVIERTPVGLLATSVTARVEAVLDGPDANVGTLTAGSLSNGATLADPLLLPVQLAVSGGTPEETDDELRERQRLYEEGTEKGTRPAIALGALMVPGVKKVVLAIRDDSHLGAQGVIYVGDRDWNSSGTMIEAVAASLEGYRGLGPIDVRGLASTDVTIAASLEMLRPATSYDPEALRAAARRNVIAYFDTRGAPYEYTVQSIGGRLERAHDEVLRATVSAPAASVPNPLSPTMLAISGFPATLTRYRTNASLITIDIVGAA
jgi:uncharacterized phage protein gp47/JayE